MDGQVFRTEGATIRAVHAPGHSHDHVCFIIEEDNAMVTGDNILGHGTAAVEHLGPWMETLKVMGSHGCKRGYPAHGVVIENLPSKIDGELASKLRRERQALRALRETGAMKNTAPGKGRGRLTVPELVTKVYGEGMDEGLRKQALEPFMDEVLRKLAADGMVGFELRKGVKNWFAIA